VFTVPNRRSQTEPKRAFAGGRVFLSTHIAPIASRNRRYRTRDRHPGPGFGAVARSGGRIRGDHHARAIARRIERQINAGTRREKASVSSVSHGRPSSRLYASSEVLYRARCDQCGRSRRDDPRAVESLAPAPVEGLLLVGGPFSLAFSRLTLPERAWTARQNVL